jgi:23S rRNA (cytidine1920-2'-O)/16S rRNA (cytidine1409-2'-O)-methyltransferase
VAKSRLDHLIVARGLAATGEKAKALILAGEVLVDGQRADKPGRTVDESAAITVKDPPKYVSRGGFKLEAALDAFAIDPRGLICVDIGSSTGGFTDCLLQRGAARVYGFDVGTNQMDWRLRQDPRVTVREGVNARYLTAADLPEPAHLLVCDVSFISLSLVLPVVPLLLRPDGRFVLLIKPQFEAGRSQVGKGGIVKDPAVHEAVCRRIELLAHEQGWQTARVDSPILGAEGNREFLLYGYRDSAGGHRLEARDPEGRAGSAAPHGLVEPAAGGGQDRP